MDHLNFTRLSSVEIGSLWYHYVTDTLAEQVLTYFAKSVQDTDIKPVVNLALQYTQNNLKASRQVMSTESMAFPVGFTATDVVLNAPRLFSDSFMLYYLKHRTQQETLNYGMSFSTASREDTRKFFEQAIDLSIKLDNEVSRVLLAKGLLIKPPHIPTPTQAEFVESPSFLGSILGTNRMLNGIEIGLLHVGIDLATVTKCLLTGFSQVVRDDTLCDYFLRGMDIAKKHIVAFSDALIKNDLQASTAWDLDVTESTVSPFSDKLMLFHATTISSYVTKMYGWGMSSSTRVDLHIDYARLMMEVMQYGEDGLQLLIKRGWMEQSPLAANRRELALQQ
ncbi:MAG TPA: DUF3231 family protein [Selenomonadales bacterium]|nr:DUF3231 family protein [Selenomonadales bacterium]